MAEPNKQGSDTQVDALATDASTGSSPRSSFSGIWLSRYEYFSTERDATFTVLYFVEVQQEGKQLKVRSLPGTESPLTMDLTVEGDVITGTWEEYTATDGYYGGAQYQGAIQMVMKPSGWRMTGRWLGLGPDPAQGDSAHMEVNTGPWELVFVDPSTSQATIDLYSNRTWI
ncbi:DNA-binding protein [Streptomyces chartreusis]|uniref:DNA-binding protein n=1 Tax=Streptomyces chartreusis TaxID=1969 RepID=UPI0037F654AA